MYVCVLGLQRRLLPRRVAAHDTDGLDLQGLENVRRHEDETSALRDVEVVSRLHGSARSDANQVPDRAIRQRDFRPGRIRVRGLGSGRLDVQAQVSLQNSRRRSSKLRRRVERYLENVGAKDEGRRPRERGTLLDHLRAASGHRPRRQISRILLLGLVLDRERIAPLGDVHHRERNVDQFRLPRG